MLPSSATFRSLRAHLQPVMGVLGIVILAFSFAMLVPLAWAVFPLAVHTAAGTTQAFAIGFGVTAASGLALWWGNRRHGKELQPRDGFLIVALVWAVVPVFAALPLLLYFQSAGLPLSFTDAYFESVSGLTTTGATVLTGLDKLPVAINVWRCFLVFVGGMGIIVLAVAVLPLLGVGGTQIFKAETPGPMKDEKLTPRIAETARGLWAVYFTMALACFWAYRWAGMSYSDAFMHMCSTMGLGGLSPYDASFGQFNSPAIEWVAVLFMSLAGVNFALHFVAFRQRSLRPLWINAEARCYIVVLLSACLLVTWYLLDQGVYSTLSESMRYSFFNVVSVATTTGFASTDYALWPMFAPVLMIFLSCFVTSAGSTGGGVKMIRVLLLVQQTQRELVRIVHPRVVNPVMLGGRPVDNAIIFSVLAFMLVYGGVIIAMTLVLLFSGLDAVTAFTAVLASVNNMGPGLGQVGPANNYQGLNDFQTWVCTVCMLLGRLELFTLLVLLMPQFWRR